MTAFVSASSARSKLTIFARVALVAGIGAALAGCAVDPAPKGSRYTVTAPAAQLYLNGPAQEPNFQHESLYARPNQDFGADFQLEKGTPVTLLKREFGFSRVITDGGVSGYIANDQIRPAPPIARAAVINLRTQRNPMPRRTRNLPNREILPELDLTDIPLPLPS